MVGDGLSAGAVEHTGQLDFSDTDDGEGSTFTSNTPAHSKHTHAHTQGKGGVRTSRVSGSYAYVVDDEFDLQLSMDDADMIDESEG